MSSYSRKELITLLEVDDELVARLEQEEVVVADAPADLYSQVMLERVRVASILLRDLGVNIEGAAIIVRMREEIADLHRELARLLAQLRA